MKARHFTPVKTYKIVELAQPYWKVQEGLLDAKIEFLYPTKGKQDQLGFLKFERLDWPSFKVLTGPLKGQTHTGLPICRIRTVRPRDLKKCHCKAWDFPHRPGSGDCPHG